LAPASQAQALAAIRSFLKWARLRGALQLSGELVADALKSRRATVRRPYPVLTEPEVIALYQAAENPRDRALLAVMLGAGLRVSEVVGLDVSDLIEGSEGGAALWVRQGKGRKDRHVPVWPEVTVAIRRYLAATGRRLGGDGPMFAAHDPAAGKLPRGRLASRSVAAVVSRLAHRAGIDAAKAVSPHALRHTYALRNLRQGGDVVGVSKLLGHASITTTQRYVDHLDVAELRASVARLPWAAA
jgi:site-specific recombinase XerD